MLIRPPRLPCTYKQMTIRCRDYRRSSVFNTRIGHLITQSASKIEQCTLRNLIKGPICTASAKNGNICSSNLSSVWQWWEAVTGFSQNQTACRFMRFVIICRLNLSLSKVLLHHLNLMWNCTPFIELNIQTVSASCGPCISACQASHWLLSFTNK